MSKVMNLIFASPATYYVVGILTGGILIAIALLVAKFWKR